MADCPAQRLEVPVTDAVGDAETDTVVAAVSEQDPEDTMTEYVVGVVGETVMEAVVEPVVHEYVPPPDAVSVSGFPLQTEEAPPIFAAGGDVVFTETVAFFVQLLAFVTVTV